MKQVILVRQDLKMDKGKMASQCAHASVEAVLSSSKEKVQAWKEGGMKKVIVKVKDEKELLQYQQLAKKEKLVARLITDAGKTFFKEATKTCLGIGPDEDSKIDKVTKHLKLV
ncbi:peptidyl-tRNA hydrolase [Candidatus Woesearchaeota archaeon]|nr:peptidyl-tRNA hydrolase [Candidatus Woesearchaeota archaeon]